MYFKLIIFTIMSLSFFSCTTIPKTATAVHPFDKSKYLGKWYEIARMDFFFEKNLDNTTAEYALNKNGTIKVVNRGFDTVSKKWKQSTGVAKFVKDENTAMLKVAFFRPFYAGYNVIALDKDYRYALVAGKNLKYLWILSRTAAIPDEVKNDFLKKAESIGYNTSRLVWVRHDE